MNPQPCPPPRPQVLAPPPARASSSYRKLVSACCWVCPPSPGGFWLQIMAPPSHCGKLGLGVSSCTPPPEHRLFIAFLGAPGKRSSSKFMIPCVRMSGLLFSLHYLPCHCHRFVLVHVGTKPCLPSKQKGIREVAPHSLSVSSKPNSNSLLKDLTCDIEKI